MPAATTAPHQVCNLALAYVGNGQTINSLEENTLEARMAKLHYAPTRDELLQLFPWRFATLREELATIAETRTGWEYVYQLPADCLTPRRIYPGQRRVTPDLEIPFDVEGRDGGSGLSGRVLLTDQPEAELIYTAECPNVALWTPAFVQAVAWALAVKLALVVPVKPALAAQAEAKALQALKRAQAAEMNARREDVEPPSPLTTSRG